MIDDNQIHATMTATNDGNDTPTDMIVDETTGRLLVKIVVEDVTTEPRSINIDANQEYVGLVLADDDTTIVPLMVNDDGAVYVDLVVE